MKKIIYSLVGLASLALASCSMDYEPIGSIVDSEALQTVDDCRAFRNGFYSNIRALSTGGYIYYTEMQMDMFVGTVINGNRIGSLANGDILSSDGDIESIWAGLFGGIANVNFFFQYSTQLLNGGTLDELQTEELKRYEAEAHFARAFFYFWLLDHYSPNYTEANKDQKLGMPLVTEYYPTAVKDGYPGRSTLAETYKFIEDDLNAALTGIGAWEKYLADNNLTNDSGSNPDGNLLRQMCPYVSTDAVKCLQARLALLKGDNDTAIAKAQEVINSGRYPLTGSRQYKNLWTSDNGSEIVFRPVSTATELGISSTGGGWNSTSQFNSDYVCTSSLANVGVSESNVYDNADDVRYVNFIGSRELVVEGRRIKAPAFVKFPGNPSLIPERSGPNLMNMPKVFRTSELYLIVAECAEAKGNTTLANEMLGAIRKVRIPGYTHTDLSGDNLKKAIRKERLRELVGEGFRMSDLRRWGEGFTRDCSSYMAYPGLTGVLTEKGPKVSYVPGDHRFVWPIPSSELQVNPQMAGQQNPGYN